MFGIKSHLQVTIILFVCCRTDQARDRTSIPVRARPVHFSKAWATQSHPPSAGPQNDSLSSWLVTLTQHPALSSGGWQTRTVQLPGPMLPHLQQLLLQLTSRDNHLSWSYTANCLEQLLHR